MTKKSAQRRRRRKDDELVGQGHNFELLSMYESHIIHQALDRLCADWWYLPVTSIILDYIWLTLRVGTYVEAYVSATVYGLDPTWKLSQVVLLANGVVSVRTLGIYPNVTHRLDFHQTRDFKLSLPNEKNRMALDCVGRSDFVDVLLPANEQFNSKWCVGYVLDAYSTMEMDPLYRSILVRWLDPQDRGNDYHTEEFLRTSPGIARLGTHTFQYSK